MSWGVGHQDIGRWSFHSYWLLIGISVDPSCWPILLLDFGGRVNSLNSLLCSSSIQTAFCGLSGRVPTLAGKGRYIWGVHGVIGIPGPKVFQWNKDDQQYSLQLSVVFMLWLTPISWNWLLWLFILLSNKLGFRFDFSFCFRKQKRQHFNPQNDPVCI